MYNENTFPTPAQRLAAIYPLKIYLCVLAYHTLCGRRCKTLTASHIAVTSSSALYVREQISLPSLFWFSAVQRRVQSYSWRPAPSFDEKIEPKRPKLPTNWWCWPASSTDARLPSASARLASASGAATVVLLAAGRGRTTCSAVASTVSSSALCAAICARGNTGICRRDDGNWVAARLGHPIRAACAHWCRAIAGG